MIIGISGMIGSGKSTLTKNLYKHYKNSLFIEEFDEEDPIFNTFLKWCYKNEPNTDIAFQSFIVESLTDTFKKKVNAFSQENSPAQSHIFLDRFILEHYIFAAATLKKKEKKYFEAFDKLFHYIYDKSCNPDFAIFIDIDWSTFKDRIFKRGRQVEIDNFYQNEEYFKDLHAMYLPYFKKILTKYNIPYYIIDSKNKNDKEVLDAAINIINNYSLSNK
ncbi:deoxynucleoside kinase [Mycoplasmopsis primatum]|uniref:deoxynucleoside kinase n=1 Tax=Mycoplasmopsis primatum TaxID=55604 RepID=UPI0004962FAE|nr:deoxynucleoside kinase [Mycoplasmopsis primatum]